MVRRLTGGLLIHPFQGDRALRPMISPLCPLIGIATHAAPPLPQSDTPALPFMDHV